MFSVLKFVVGFVVMFIFMNIICGSDEEYYECDEHNY
jgi:hypothetical protein